MRSRHFLTAAAFLLATFGGAHADELRPAQGATLDLGPVSGTAYYTVAPEGLRVVATLGQGEAAVPVRIEAVLAPGQSVILSTPHAPGVAAETVEIRRQQDRLLVRKVALTN